AQDEVDCSDHPGGCRCYYDALADGCASAIPQGGQIALCSCDYRDNNWLRVHTAFLRFFKGGLADRAGLLAATVQDKGNGLYSVDVGHKDRLECSASHTRSWPGTGAVLDFDEIGKMVNAIFFGQ
ncbi:unnamed protein product, partial [Polarella glacialis]